MKLRFKYPYEVFEEHENALEQVLGWEHTRIFGELGSRSDYAANQARILEYFSDSYKNRDESAEKSECFRQILEYTQQHRKLFERAGLYVKGAEIDDALMRSIHFVFTSAQIPIQSNKVHPKLVVKLAKAFKKFESAKPYSDRRYGFTFRNLLFPPKG